MTALLISLAAIILTVFLYSRRPVGLMLRISAIVLLAVMILNITLQWENIVPKNRPIVVVDNSMSMKAHHPDIIRRLSSIDQPYDLFFSQESLLTQNQQETPGTYTDLSGALEKARQRNPAAIILITDGNHNFGVLPFSTLAEFNTPVYAYGVGEENPRNAAISSVEYPKYTYVKDSVIIQALVETGGFKTGLTELTLRSAHGKKISVHSIPLSEVPAQNKIEFTYFASEPGTVQLKMDIPPQPAEVSYEDNSYTFSLNVLQEKIRVLYFTDHVSFNTKFIHRALKKDGNLSITATARTGSMTYLDINQGTALDVVPDVREFDVLILDNVNLERLPWRNIKEMLHDGTGLVLIGSLDGINSAWLDIIPINVTRGIMHGAYRIDITEPFSVLTANSNPPVGNISRIIAAKDDAVIIAHTGNLPVVGYRVHGRGRVFQICIVDLGPWHFLRSGLKGDAFLDLLMSDVARFVSPSGEHLRLLVSTMDRDYALGETIHLTLQSYDRNFRRAGGGDFFLTGNNKNVPFYETKAGYYQASYIADQLGQQSVLAQGELNGERLSSNVLNINVTSRSAESEHRLNRELLERIAAITGGEFHLLHDMETITLPETATRKATRMLNFDSPLTYFIVLLFLIADWIMRRRRGLT